MQIKKLIATLLSLSIIFLMTACGEQKQENRKTTKNNITTSIVKTQEKTQNKSTKRPETMKETQNESTEDLKKTEKTEETGHVGIDPEKFDVKSYEIRTDDHAAMFFVVKNNGNTAATLNGKVNAYDGAGAVIDSATFDIPVVGQGEETAVDVYLYKASKAEKLDYKISYDTPIFKPIVSLLKTEENRVEDGITVKVTNPTDQPTDSVKACALFFDKNQKLVNFTSLFLSDPDGQIKPGESFGCNLRAYGKKFDSFKIYYDSYVAETDSGRARKLTKEDADIKTELLTNAYAANYYAILKSNLEGNMSFSGNAIAYNKANKIIDCSNANIDVLGKGGESVCEFYFDTSEEIDHIDYTFYVVPAEHMTSVVEDLKVKSELNDDKATVSVTNSGKSTAKYVTAYVFFYDAKDKLLGVDTRSVGDADDEIKAKATVKVNAEIFEEGSDHIKVYLSAIADTEE